MRRRRADGARRAMGMHRVAIARWETRIRSVPRARRRGLATLELVIAIPLFLGLMALIVNFGAVASWKVRALSVARFEAFAARWPRSAADNPQPAYWPQAATAEVHAGRLLSELDDPRLDQPAIRGPQLGAVTVNRDLFDPTLGALVGHAEHTRRFPLLGRLGNYTQSTETELLDRMWQFPTSRWPDEDTGLASNWDRRVPVIYRLYQADASRAEAYARAVTAVYALMTSPGTGAALAVLDNDAEYLAYAARFGWALRSPDYHARLVRFCTVDKTLADVSVQNLIDRIQGRGKRGAPDHIESVAERLAEGFIGLYRHAIRDIRRQSAPNPPPPGSQGEINSLESKIRDLQRFLDSLTAASLRGNGGSRTRGLLA